MLGLAPSELLGMSLADFTDGAGLAVAASHAAATDGTTRPTADLQLKPRDGTSVWAPSR